MLKKLLWSFEMACLPLDSPLPREIILKTQKTIKKAQKSLFLPNLLTIFTILFLILISQSYRVSF
jgi:hypothetical protein